MTENEIIAVLNRELRASSGYIGGEIVSRRRKSLEYYLGKPFGNEQEGRSQVVSTDVSDTVESLMPSSKLSYGLQLKFSEKNFILFLEISVHPAK